MNKAPLTPTYKDAQDNFARDLKYGLYCHLPAKIVSYDRSTGTATVQIQHLRVLPNYKAPLGYTTQPYVPITSVPVFFIGNAGATVGGDPAPGDACTLMVMDRDMTQVKAGGAVQGPPSDRSHDLSDCYALMAQTKVTTARDAGEFGIAEASPSGAKVVVINGKVSVANGTKNLATVLEDLVLGIQGLTCASPGSPVVDSTGKVAAALLDLALLLQ